MKPSGRKTEGFAIWTMYQVYVIQNPTGRIYIGLSDDIDRRLAQHNAGVSTWTRNRGPWHCIWHSDPLHLGDARRLEILLKRQKGGAGLWNVIGIPKPPRS